MTTATTAQAALWSEEPSDRPGRARIRARIGGLHCSLCTGTIEKALGRQKGVDTVAVSLTHEQALVEFDPQVVKPEVLLQVLRDIGYRSEEHTSELQSLMRISYAVFCLQKETTEQIHNGAHLQQQSDILFAYTQHAR